MARPGSERHEVSMEVGPAKGGKGGAGRSRSMTRAVHIARSVGGTMRDYLGVDWADAEHAVWVEDEAGAKGISRPGPQTGDGPSEFGRGLDARRAAGGEGWAGRGT